MEPITSDYRRLQRKRRERKRRQLKRHRQQLTYEAGLLRVGRRTFLLMLGLMTLRWVSGKSDAGWGHYRAIARRWLGQEGQGTTPSWQTMAHQSAHQSAHQTDNPSLGQPAQPASPIPLERISINGIPLYRTVIDLTDPETFITIGLAKSATKANSSKHSVGDEPFQEFLARYSGAALVANGTFFSMDAQKRVMGNMVSEGRFLKYSPWENYGTTLGIRDDKRLEMVTARVEGKPQWDEHWFSMTCGPRLLKQGQVWIAPKSEGFRDPSVLGIGTRSALGFPQGGDKLILATFLRSLSLEEEAKAMKALGCYEAMNLDGGTSVALAHRGELILDAQRPLTNVLVVYDVDHPAPPEIRESWQRFQQGERPVPWT